MDERKAQEPDQSQPIVQAGTHAVIELCDTAGQRERLEFDLVPDELADVSKGFLGVGTPLAKAICGQPAGRTIPYRRADIISVHILSVAPAHAAPEADAAQHQDATLRKAVEEAQRTDAIVFASSFSGKWGDYDPQGMEHWDKTDE